MSQATRLHIEEVQEKLILGLPAACGPPLLLPDARSAVSEVEDVCLDELSHQVPPQLRRYLQGMHPKTQEYFNDVFDVVVHLLGLEQLLFVIVEDSLGEDLAAALRGPALTMLVAAALELVEKDLVVLAKADFVAFNGFT